MRGKAALLFKIFNQLRTKESDPQLGNATVVSEAGPAPSSDPQPSRALTSDTVAPLARELLREMAQHDPALAIRLQKAGLDTPD